MTTTPNRGMKVLAPQRGEVWLVDFDPSVGEEQRKIRPAVVVSVPEVGRLPLRIVVTSTSWNARYEAFVWFVHVLPTPENGLTKDSGADSFQVKSVSLQRFHSWLGSLTAEQMDDIAAALALCVGY
jgi:mRNA interferase MazF